MFVVSFNFNARRERLIMELRVPVNVLIRIRDLISDGITSGEKSGIYSPYLCCCWSFMLRSDVKHVTGTVQITAGSRSHQFE